MPQTKAPTPGADERWPRASGEARRATSGVGEHEVRQQLVPMRKGHRRGPEALRPMEERRKVVS